MEERGVILQSIGNNEIIAYPNHEKLLKDLYCATRGILSILKENNISWPEIKNGTGTKQTSLFYVYKGTWKPKKNPADIALFYVNTYRFYLKLLEQGRLSLQALKGLSDSENKRGKEGK